MNSIAWLDQRDLIGTRLIKEKSYLTKCMLVVAIKCHQVKKKFHPLRVNHEDQTKHMSEQFGENQNEKFDKNDFAWV